MSTLKPCQCAQEKTLSKESAEVLRRCLSAAAPLLPPHTSTFFPTRVSSVALSQCAGLTTPSRSRRRFSGVNKPARWHQFRERWFEIPCHRRLPLFWRFHAALCGSWRVSDSFKSFCIKDDFWSCWPQHAQASSFCSTHWRLTGHSTAAGC